MSNHKNKLEKFRKDSFTNVYKDLMDVVDEFNRTTKNCPAAYIKILQNTHEAICLSSRAIYIASNIDKNDFLEKAKNIQEAEFNIHFLYSNLEYLVKCGVLTIGSANNVICSLQKILDQLRSWYTFEISQSSQE